MAEEEGELCVASKLFLYSLLSAGGGCDGCLELEPSEGARKCTGLATCVQLQILTCTCSR